EPPEEYGLLRQQAQTSYHPKCEPPPWLVITKQDNEDSGSERPPEDIEDVIGIDRAVRQKDQSCRRSKRSEPLNPSRAAQEPRHQPRQHDCSCTDQRGDDVECPEGVAGEKAGNEGEPGKERRYIHIAKGGMLAHGDDVELVAEIAVVVANQ